VPGSGRHAGACLGSSRAATHDSGVLVLGGPTASGKSDVAADLAQRVGGAVVCADSRQVYRGLEIGTAQPDRRQRERAPHFLTGFLSPAAPYSAGGYGEDAGRVVAALRGRGVPVVLCGGTGLYLRAALGGLFRQESAPASAQASRADAGAARPAGAHGPERAALARRWEEEGGAALHAELARLDPALARRVPETDRQRVLRGLAFHAATGRPLSAAWERADAGSGDPSEGAVAVESSAALNGEVRRACASLRFWLAPAAPELDARIRTRLDGMLEAGLVEEARALHERYGQDSPASLNAVGYSELFGYLEGRISLDTAVTRIGLRTRQYAKRQRTWFRHQDGYVALPGAAGAVETLLAAWRPGLGRA
jgi:tRNA dimethylallyltransferase